MGFLPVSVAIIIFSFFVDGGVSQSYSVWVHVFCYHCICPNDAIVSYLDIPDYFCSGASKNVIAKFGHGSVPATVTDRHIMVNRAMGTQFYSGMKNDATKMMYSKTLADAALSRNGYSSRDFDKPLDEKAKWLCGDCMAMKPIEKPIDEDGLESL